MTTGRVVAKHDFWGMQRPKRMNSQGGGDAISEHWENAYDSVGNGNRHHDHFVFRSEI
jgi:hypothetical protein